MIVTHIPASARKQGYTFAEKLEAMRQELLGMRTKVRDKVPHWQDEEAVRERYIRFCEQLFTCVVAMTYLRRIELKMAAAGRTRSIEKVMNGMRQLHDVLSVRKGIRTPERRLETPSKSQSEVLSAFGYHVDESGVLHGPAF